MRQCDPYEIYLSAMELRPEIGILTEEEFYNVWKGTREYQLSLRKKEEKKEEGENGPFL